MGEQIETVQANETTAAKRRSGSLFEDLSVARLTAMRQAGEEVLECYRVLTKVDANIVGEVLKGQGTFYEWDHYPEGDVYDKETHSQYYYHAHRGAQGEHGHFHTFLRQKGMPSGVDPVAYDGEAEWPTGDERLSHLVAISRDKKGFPTHLFTTNRWVTGESFYEADDVIRLLDRFAMDHAWPSWPTNRWVTAMLVLFRPQLEQLLHERDAAIEDWRRKHADVDAYEDRDLEITSMMPVSVGHQIKQVAKALNKAGAV